MAFFLMHPFAKEFFQLKKSLEYSDLLEDSEWGYQKSTPIVAPLYSELLEDTDWG
tara:strand:+ start:155 stop:319 length:165 start_codon:yes stop_codon:yes gene_type:complete